MRKSIEEYLTFSRKERTGIVILMSVILVVAVAPAFFRSISSADNGEEINEYFRNKLATSERQFSETDSTGHPEQDLDGGSEQTNLPARADSKSPDISGSTGYPASNMPARIVMKPFDPNTISVAEWVGFGVRERTAHTIEKYRLKGGRFRQPDDILRIYGLSETDKKRLLPFVRIGAGYMDPRSQNGYGNGGYQPGFGAPRQEPGPADPPRQIGSAYQSRQSGSDYQPQRNGSDNQLQQSGLAYQPQQPAWPDRPQQPGYNNGKVQPAYPKKVLQVIDINSADTASWSSLPGIGPVLSRRIIKYRERLGGFYHVKQVAEIYGLADSVFQRIQPYLRCEASVQKINVNLVTPDVLEQHPYLRRQLARAIIDYRTQHGTFKELAELRQVIAMTPELFDRISPYLAL